MASVDSPSDHEGSGSSKHREPEPEPEHEHEHEHEHESPKADENSEGTSPQGLLIQLDSEHEEEPTEHESLSDHDHDSPTAHDETSPKHESPPPEQRHSTSSSSSSSSSEDEDFFQLDTSEIATKPAAVPGEVEAPSNSTTTPVPQHDTVPAATAPAQTSGGTTAPVIPEAAAAATTQAATPAPVPMEVDSPASDAPTQSPSEQVMIRNLNDIQDPNRIPSSVFARTKSTAPMEWSVASNESLFSIHMGNNSFSRDHAILLGRSGELGYIGELDPLPPAPVAMTPEVANAEAMEEVLRAAANEHAEKERDKGPSGSGGPPNLRSTSQRSDASATSINSFAFPILTGEGGRAGSVKVEAEKGQSEQAAAAPPPEATAEGQTTPAGAAPDAPAQTSWCCISCNFCR